MKFKYILTTFAAAGALMLTSCEGMLDIPQHSVSPVEGYYDTDAGAEEGITAVYGMMRNLENGMCAFSQFKDFLSDDVWTGGGSHYDGTFYMLNDYTFGTEYGTLSTVYGNLYNMIYAANVAEDDLADDGASNPGVQAVREYAAGEQSEVFVVCAQIEQEIAELDEDEKKMFLEDLGLSESGLEKLIKASYRILGLISYLTAGEPEVRAWTITKGTKAPQAAGKIHSDFERGFIRAEVVSYDDLIACGSHNAAKEKGLIRLEGKDYVVKDGDIMLFRFNV
jgi:hypothetical protein